MTPLDDLPAEQRAVLELVLKRGRTYDEIAALLSIDRAGVRQRALTGLDALGPSTSVPPERRALITDYLLGQLPERVSEQVAQRLATEASDRAWARVIASELTPVAATPLPRIPTGADLQQAEPQEAEPDDNDYGRSAVEPRPAGVAETAASGGGRGSPPAVQAALHSSRLGGAILLGLGAVIVVAIVILVLVLSSGSSKSPTTSSTAASAPPATTTPGAAGTTATGTGTTGTTPQSLATVKLSPVTPGSKAQGVAEAFNQSNTPYLAIVAINLAPNSHNYYAVWLTNSSTDSRLLGFAPAVTGTGRLQAATQLKSTDAHYKTLVVTLETQPHPKTPGTTVLSGAFSPKSL